MNRKVIGILLTVVMLLSIISLPAFAQQEQVDVYEGQTLIKSVAFIIGLDVYFVNDQVPGVKMDTAPFIQNGRTFVPVRFLGNALGVPDKDILWNQAERRVDMKRGTNSLSLVIGKARITVNGQAKDIDVSPTIRDGRTFLPARYVAEGLGFNVDWDAANKIVICWPKNSPKPVLSEVIKKAVEFNGKPEAVKKLESALGITMESADRPGYSNPGRWCYNAPAPYLPEEPARSEILANKYKSYVYANYDNGYISVNIRFAPVPDISGRWEGPGVTYDLSPIEKTLRAFFPGQEAKFPAIMAKAREIAEVTKQSNRFERANVAEFNLNGKVVELSSEDLNFVSLVFKGV